MKNILLILMLVAGCLLSFSCAQEQKEGYKSPQGYNLNQPEKYVMPDELHEISGIAFHNGNPDTVYAEQDEEGKVFYAKLGEKSFQHTIFGKHGDFEDIAIYKNQVFMLKSKGKLYTFPLAEVRQPQVAHVQELGSLLPEGEFESLYADPDEHKLYTICKNCADEKTTKTSSGFIFDIADNGQLQSAGSFKVRVKEIDRHAGESQMKFRPSALSKNPLTHQWYILSSVNKLLVVTDANWQITATYALDPTVFRQPEGITFDKSGNLYISNEGDELGAGNILKFAYSAAK